MACRVAILPPIEKDEGAKGDGGRAVSARIIRTDADRELACAFLREQKLPLSVTIKKGGLRTVEQNRLQRMWCNEISDQLGDQTPEEVRGFCKLTMGVPILRADDEDYCALYDERIRPLPYETKLAYMMLPFDFAVTRIMTVEQKTRYLDSVHRFFSSKGIVLTSPDQPLSDASLVAVA